MTAVYTITPDDNGKIEITEFQNLILNMSGGLLPEHLSSDEVMILKEKLGENWFEELGYSEPTYKKPEKIWQLKRF